MGPVSSVEEAPQPKVLLAWTNPAGIDIRILEPPVAGLEPLVQFVNTDGNRWSNMSPTSAAREVMAEILRRGGTP